MKTFKKIRKAFLGTLLTLSLLFASVPILACEEQLQSMNDILEITDPEDITQAVKLLGLTDEEAKESTFYSANIETIGEGVTEMPTFTMWGYNRGSDRIFNGTRLRTAIVIKGDTYAYLHVRFCSYERVLWFSDLTIGDEGYAVDNPDYWQNILYGGTYFMTYEAMNSGDNGIKVTVIFALM